MGWYTGLKASVSAYLKLRRKRSRHLGNVELKSRTGPFGPVVSQLRARARTFEFWGRVVLFALLVVVGVGIGCYFYSPNLQDANVIEGRVHAQTISLRQDDLNSLDKERDTLRDEMLARVQQVFVARPIEVPDYLGLPDLFVSEIDFGPRGEAIALGPDGRILTRGSGQSDWVAGPVSPDPGRLDEVHIGPDGYAIALGKGGTILTREPGQAEWIDRTVDGTSAQFRDAAIGENGDVVVVGTAGTIVTREPGVSAWASQQIDDISVILYDVELGEDGEAVIVGTGGTILTRAPGKKEWVKRSVKQVTAALFAIRFAEAGEAVAVGNNGAILTRGPGATDWVDRTVDGVEAALLDVRFGPDGEAVIVAANGTILTRGVGNNAWIVQTLDGVSAYLRDVDFGRYGEAVIVGDGGTILTRAPGRTEWNAESVDGVSDDLRTVRFGDNGDVVIIGRGTILTRSSDNQDWIARFVHQVSTRLSSVDFGPNDEAMVLSSFPPIIFATTNEHSSEIGSAKTEDEPRTAFYEIPEYEKSPLLLERLSAIEAQRKQVKEDLKKAESEIAKANSGRLSRRQRLEEFQKHMEDCAPKGSNAAEIAACAQALENVVIRTEEDAWWEQVAEQVPPAVLLLFLLATLGSLYRYNLRMAAFYHGRADALELSKDVLHKETFDRIAETLAGDGVQFRGSKTPIDNVTEIANTLISKLDLKKAS